jgi:hypothetical protein
VVAVRTEREPNRYEPLKEAHRRAAEEEEKRRLAEQEQVRSASAQSEPQPVRPGPELRPSRPEITPDHDPDSPEARLAARERELKGPGNEARPSRPELRPDHDPDSPEARLAAKEQELQERVRLGRISPSEMIYELRQFDNELRVEIEHGGGPLRDGSGTELESAQPERAADTRDQPTDQSRDDPRQRTPEARIEREAEAAEYEIVGRGEMSAARAARLERLRGIDREVEREHREKEGKGLDLDHGSGDHAR